MDAYTPQPIDTNGVTLPEPLVRLTERLAANAHDLWAQQRLAEGWRVGPTRDDRQKQHPCLVPYDKLPDSERAYDRRNAMETLKAIMVLGYRIVPPPVH